MTKVLLTGGSGFIAAHCLEQLLAKNHTVVTTVRTDAKRQAILDAYPDAVSASRLDVHIVPDIAQLDAFNQVLQVPGLEAVLHTASPFHFNWSDPKTELIDPAVNGTTGILQAIQAHGKDVRRVVVTSSFAAILDETKFADPGHTFSEASWNPSTVDNIHDSKPTAYRVSKTLAERAAWDFVGREKPAFDLVTVCPPLVFGPVVHHLATLENINTSNERIVTLLKGGWKDKIPDTGAVPLWVDVRDVARAHVVAMEKKELGGERLFTTPGCMSHREIVDIVRRKCPEFKERLPAESVQGGERPKDSEMFSYDVSKTNTLLGIEWIGLEKSIGDLVESLKGKGI